MQRQKKVLLVDDDAAVRWMLREALTDWGYCAVEAATQADAWAMITEKPSRHYK